MHLEQAVLPNSPTQLCSVLHPQLKKTSIAPTLVFTHMHKHFTWTLAATQAGVRLMLRTQPGTPGGTWWRPSKKRYRWARQAFATATRSVGGGGEDGGWGRFVPMETVQSAHLYGLCAVRSYLNPMACRYLSWTWQHALTCRKKRNKLPIHANSCKENIPKPMHGIYRMLFYTFKSCLCVYMTESRHTNTCWESAENIFFFTRVSLILLLSISFFSSLFCPFCLKACGESICFQFAAEPSFSAF